MMVRVSGGRSFQKQEGEPGILQGRGRAGQGKGTVGAPPPHYLAYGLQLGQGPSKV
jgi:hypothetical protein